MSNRQGPQLAPETEFNLIEQHLRLALRVYTEITDQPMTPHLERELRLVQAIIDVDNMELISLAQKTHGFWPGKDN